MSGRVILASNRLPITVTDDNGTLTAQRSIGGVATALDAIFQSNDSLWVGWVGVRRELSDTELHDLELPETLVPVQAGDELVRGYYDHFSNQVLWPSMHGFWPRRAPSTSDWEALNEIAKRFAQAIKKVAEPEDVIWVHDYHLVMLPAALRAAGLENQIGFFLHTPFATPEHVRSIPHHQEILHSLCDVDLFGVQTEREVKQMHNCLKTLEIKRQPGVIKAFPIGIDYDLYNQEARKPALQRRLQKVRQEKGNQRTILSVSRLDYTKGIIAQLQGVAEFLASQPEPQHYRYKVVVAPSRTDVTEYRELKHAIDRTVKVINDSLGTREWQPIDYHYNTLGLLDMRAWYMAADVLLAVPVIDGMNLIVKEFVAARHDDDGMLVMSTQMGAAAQLTSALQVEPENPAAIASALQQAIAMSPEERAERWHALRENVRTENVYRWADDFVSDLQRVTIGV
jgi:trehalose 6-phosphate synthase/phosphatase